MFHRCSAVLRSTAPCADLFNASEIWPGRRVSACSPCICARGHRERGFHPECPPNPLPPGWLNRVPHGGRPACPIQLSPPSWRSVFSARRRLKYSSSSSGVSLACVTWSIGQEVGISLGSFSHPRGAPYACPSVRTGKSSCAPLKSGGTPCRKFRRSARTSRAPPAPA
jgi:hypothetical protein